MSIKWTLAMMLIFLLGSLISAMLELAYLGGTEGTVISGLWTGLELGQGGGGIVGLVRDAIGIITWGVTLPVTLWHMVSFDYAMFEGTYQVVRWFFWCLGLAWFLSTATVFFRGTSSA